jgi:hypothetical protein
MVWIGGTVVGVSYDIPQLRSRLGVDFNAVYTMHQPNMNLKTYFVNII